MESLKKMGNVYQTRNVESAQDLNEAEILLIAQQLPQYFSEQDVMQQIKKIGIEFEGGQYAQINFAMEFLVKNGKPLAGKFFIPSLSRGFAETLEGVHRRIHGEPVTIGHVIAGIAQSLRERGFHF